jgi:hypothetical protein
MLSKKQRSANIGRFVNDGKGNIVYVDNHEKVWTHEQIAEMIQALRVYRYFNDTIQYYKKLL